MTPYRQNIINSYYYIASSQFLLFKGAFMIHMDLEIEDIDYYLESAEDMDNSIFADSDDIIVKTINTFIEDTDKFLHILKDINQLQETDIEYCDIGDEDEDESDKQVKANKHIGFIIFLLTVNILNRTEKAIKSLCEIKNEIPAPDFKSEWQYDDDNIYIISIFYRKLSMLVEFLERETKSIDGKRNW